MSHLYHWAGILCNASCFMICGKDNIKIVPVHNIKAYKKSRGTVPLIHNLSTTCGWLVKFMTPLPRERTPSNHQTGCCMGPIASPNVLQKEKSLVPARNGTPYHPAQSLVTTPASYGCIVFWSVVYIVNILPWLLPHPTCWDVWDSNISIHPPIYQSSLIGILYRFMQMISWYNNSKNACFKNISSNLSDIWTSSQKKFHPTVF